MPLKFIPNFPPKQVTWFLTSKVYFYQWIPHQILQWLITLVQIANMPQEIECDVCLISNLIKAGGMCKFQINITVRYFYFLQERFMLKKTGFAKYCIKFVFRIFIINHYNNDALKGIICPWDLNQFSCFPKKILLENILPSSASTQLNSIWGWGKP